MVKTKTLKKRRICSKSTKTKKMKINSEIDSYDPTAALLDEARISKAIWECLKDGDSEGVVEIIKIHLEAINKTKLAEQAQISKTTMYHALRSKNPTIKTLAKLINGVACS